MRETLGRESLKRTLSLIATLAMVLGMCPVVGMADDGGMAPDDGTTPVVQGQDDNVLTTQVAGKDVKYLDANGKEQTAHGVIELDNGDSWETHGAQMARRTGM